MLYDLFTHRHNFAVWTAARSVQRAFEGATTQNIRLAIEQSQLPAFTSVPTLNVSADRFDELHRQWCGNLGIALGRLKVQDVTYGRLAKLIAVYLKTTIIIGPGAYSPLGQVAHPPIDNNLLINLAQAQGIDSPHQQNWRDINWTQLNEQGYYELVAQLREIIPRELPFWMIEEYWII